jgi:outer membrane protein OmpA-like peptidoglycan-associated protein
MADPPIPGGSDRALQDERAAAPGGQNEWNGLDELAELRALLVGPEQLQLSKLQERLDNPQLRAEDISGVLPHAIFIRASKDLQPGRAPVPAVEEALAATASAGPRALVDALAPLMGPTLRKAVVRVFSEAARLWVVLGVLILGLGGWLSFSMRDYGRWSAYVERLRAEPGVVVVFTGKQGGKYFVAGLRDPLAADPFALQQEARLDPARVISRWELFQALHPQFILARAKSVLEPPETVTLRVDNGILFASGAAPHQWIVEARRLARAIPGVGTFSDKDLVDTDVLQARALSLTELASAKEHLEKSVLRFVAGTTALVPGQDAVLEDLVATTRGLLAAAQFVGQDARVVVAGHTARKASPTTNRALSRARADAVISLLVAKGIPQAGLSVAPAGVGAPAREEHTERDRALNRSATFIVVLLDTPSPQGKTGAP